MAIDDAELAQFDTVGLAALIRDGQLSPVEAVQATIDRIEASDGVVNAVIHRRFEQALEEAAGPLPDGPFRGVPWLLKDLWPTSAGDPFHMGNQALKNAQHRHPHDSHLTQRYREAGFIIVGRTNTPELGLVATTEPVAYGPTRNPWDTDRGPGGSSGGAAAAVAAGYVPAANASDGGGSIRIPAAMCGLVGLKPSRGRVPMGPLQDEWGLSVQHAVCHTMRDCAAILDVSARPTLGDGVIAPPTGQPYLDRVGQAPDRLRIGVWNDPPRDGLDIHPDVAAATAATANLLQRLGHDVSESHPAMLDNQDIGMMFTAAWMAGARANLDKIGAMVGRDLTADDVEPSTWAMAQGGAELSAVDLLGAQGAMHEYRRGVATWYEAGWDLLLTPTTCAPAPEIGDLVSTPDDPMRSSLRSIPYAAFTSAFNVTGQPAISLPLGRSAAGLPIGVQLIAAYGREDLLIQIGSQLEAEVNWSTTRAPVHP